MTKSVDINEAASSLRELVSLASADDEIIVDDSKPVARLQPIPPAVKQRIPNLHPGSVWMAPDFNEFIC